jgi:hypothetical protein
VGWVGLFGGYGFQNEKFIKKMGFGQNPTNTQKTHWPTESVLPW